MWWIYLILFVFSWLLVTLIGHATWVVFARLFRTKSDASQASPAQSNKNRFAIANSVIRQLHEEGRISSEWKRGLLAAARTSENDGCTPSASESPEPSRDQDTRPQTDSILPAEVAPNLDEVADEGVLVARLATDDEVNTTLGQPIPSAHPINDSDSNDLSQAGLPQNPDPIAASRHLGQAPQNKNLTTETSRPTLPPALSTSEIIQSFLSAHNIRWGELIAGMLIVVCSIGLVISLWGPLVKTHRAIPTLIFLAANAAIYSVGLYTLSRWRLRHTSRTILVIATLLIPLSVLAGMAASGIKSNQAIELGDPVTLVTIVIAGIIYSVFLYLGGKALSSRAHVLSIVAAVAGPVLTLVLTPAAIRSSGMQAGWYLALGTAFVIAACARMGGAFRRKSTPLGPAGVRLRLLVLGFSAYSLAVAAVSMGYHLREYGTQAFLPMAMATLPACVALAGVARSLTDRARNGTVSIIGTVCCILLLTLTLVVIIPAMSSHAWLWTWAVIMSVSLIAGRVLFQQPSWYAISTLPLGLVAVFTAQVWLGSEAWGTNALWTRVVNGEAMLASLLMSATTGALLWALSKNPAGKWMKYTNLGWVSLTLFLAITLSLAPASFMGVVPSWVVTLTLFSSAVTAFIYSLRDYRVCYGTALATFFGYYSLFRMLPSVSLETSSAWMYLSLCLSATMLIFSELSCQLAGRLGKSLTLNAQATRHHLAAISIGVVGIATIAACFGLNDTFGSSVLVFSISTILLVWASLLMASVDVLKAAQLMTLLLAAAVAHHNFDTQLMTQSGWRSGDALWGWSLTFGTVAGFWYLIREAILLYFKRFQSESSGLTDASTNNTETPDKGRIGLLFKKPIPPLTMLDGWFGVAAATLSVGATIYFFASLAMSVNSGVLHPYVPSWGLPLLSVLLVATLTGLLKRQDDENKLASWLAGSTGLLLILWLSCQVATSLLTDVKMMLILAVNLTTIVIFAVKALLRRTDASILSNPIVMAGHATQCCTLFLGSASLLYSGVLQPIAAGQLTDLYSSVSISVWWFTVSMLSLWHVRKTAQEWSLILSLLFFAAAGSILVPAFTVQPTMVLIQTAALLTVVWLVLANRLITRQEGVDLKPKIREINNAIFKLVVAMGMITSVLAIIRILMDVNLLDSLMGPVGFTLSLTAAAAMVWKRLQILLTGAVHKPGQVSVPIVLAVLAGQIAWLLHSLGLLESSLSGSQSVEVMAGVWVLTSVASLLRYRSRQSIDDFLHIAAVTVVTAVLATIFNSQFTIMPGLCLIAVITAGALVSLIAIGRKNKQIPDLAVRTLGWIIGIAGGCLIWRCADLSNYASTSLTILWLTLWIVIWRYISRDQPSSDEESKNRWCLPDMEFSIILFAAALADIGGGILSVSVGNPLTNPLLWLKGFCYVISAVSVLWRPRHAADWFLSMATAGFAFALLIVSTADAFSATTSQRFIVMLVGYALFFVVVTNCSSIISRIAGQLTSIPADVHFQKLTRTLIAILTLVAVAGIASPIIMITYGVPLAEIQIAIVTVALTAWAIAEIADQASIARLRYVAVSLGLASVALWATVGSNDVAHMLLAASMRWLVASALILPVLLAVLPKMLGEQLGSRWMNAFRMGAKITAIAAAGSTFAMLAMEYNLRDSNGISDISLVVVLGAGATLGILSLICGVVAIATGSNGKLQMNLQLTDQQRSQLIMGTQLLGLITWLHVFLCKPDWAFIGLQGVWPYTVMGLAFASVGMTEFARQRGDHVLSATIKKTALYLPLIPVVGLWLSSSNQSNTIIANMVDSHYEILLVLAAAYYMAIGMRWKSVMPRVTGIVLGNAAWWFVLAQWPGWGFLLHPQLWLIPPAVCVLLVTHFYRDRLNKELASGIRYASTLLIYISSSADMLLQQIGMTLAGPVILILLALTGMLLGVVLRIRPFLYLGATFVFLGLTSMVWHAHRAFDSVWPWWVFGISMGLLLLAGLMLLERFKPQLRKHAENLATWDS